MQDEQKLIPEIIERILSVDAPDRVILFGSSATGRTTRDSDIDLLVLFPSPSDAMEKSVRLRGALRGLGSPFDVVVMATERFEETKNVVGGIAYPANKYGRVIYEAA